MEKAPQVLMDFSGTGNPRALGTCINCGGELFQGLIHACATVTLRRSWLVFPMMIIIRAVAIILFCAAVSYPVNLGAQDVIPRSEVQELLDIHARERAAFQGQIAALEHQIAADQKAIDALVAANEKLQQGVGSKISIWGKVWWGIKTLGPLIVGSVAAARE